MRKIGHCRDGYHTYCGGYEQDRGDGTWTECECSCHADRLSEAMAIMKDTADRSMRKGGRTAWNREDYNAGVDAFNKCLSKDKETK